MSALDLDHLESLLAAATPAPWTAYRQVHAERGDDMTPEECGEYVRNSVVNSARESGSSEFLAILAQKIDGPADVCLVGNGPTSPANAKLIEALRNAAPDLLRIARAVRDWRAAVAAFEATDREYLFNNGPVSAVRSARDAREAAWDAFMQSAESLSHPNPEGR